MSRKISNFLCILLGIIFVVALNIFLKFTANILRIIAIDIVLILNLILILINVIAIWLVFRKFDFTRRKKFRKNIGNSVAKSFLVTSIISIVYAILIYTLAGKIINHTNLASSIKNYFSLYSKIWFVVAPFTGLEFTIFEYFSKIDSNKKTVFLCLFKFLIYILLTGILYLKVPNQCFVYAKPISDIIFLPYFIKTCLELTYKQDIEN